eukprot:TRINITY_DN24660_c0_g1_i1.p1 TRINITY_DN24660_c0_g1~~TRINITY_DN24660_c0_g1_i1.p1  ORF type:complete len:276 (-),score=42.13 TRINITY_DN24660_c0_g1_i1:670-1497(-)
MSHVVATAALSCRALCLQHGNSREMQVPCGPVSRSIGFSSSPFVSASRIRTQRGQQNVSRERLSTRAGAVVTEPDTGIPFLGGLTAPGGTKELILLGSGVREKKIAFINVKVYAVGLYVEPAITESLGSFKGKDLARDEEFSYLMSKAPVEKSFRIVLARDVEGKQFGEALAESLGPRLKAAGAGAEGERDVALFDAAFQGRSLKKDTSIFLTAVQPSTLQIGILEPAAKSDAAASLVAIESAPLIGALFDVYLGAEPVSPAAKASIARGVTALL